MVPAMILMLPPCLKGRQAGNVPRLITIPGSREVLIDDSGHMPQLEKPVEFNRIVTEFLKQQGRLTSARVR